MKVLFFTITVLLQIIFHHLHGFTFTGDPSILYTIGMPFPSNHLFDIKISITNHDPDGKDYVEFQLPVWRPGRYSVLNFASGVQQFDAFDLNGNPLRWEKIDKSTWRIYFNNNNSFDLSYRVFANEFSIRTRGLNDERAFVDASTVLMYAENLRKNPVEIKINVYDDWHVTTGLDRTNISENVFYAKDYDYLVDCPMLIGKQNDFDFYINNVKHTVSFSGNGNYNETTVTEDIKKITECIQNYWGDFPYNHFTFMLVMNPVDGGATEHINSTIINVHPLVFANRENYTRFLSTIAHEYFHTWNVKQLRPKGLNEYNYLKENYSGELWIAEGTTSYYENIFLTRCGFMDEEKFLERLANSIRNDLERPGNYVQSLKESSFDAWIKHSMNSPNKFNSESDFYSKGANVSLLLDLEIRNSSKNKFSLDDVMRRMYKDFPLNKGGYTNNDFLRTCEEYAGKSLNDFFESYVSGVDTLQWAKYLNYAGLDLKTSSEKERTSLGINTRESGDRLYIASIIPGQAGYEAGLDINDEIIALNGFRVRASNLSNRIADMKNGEVVTLTVMRDEELRDFKIILKEIRPIQYKIEKLKRPDWLQKNIFETWLN